MPLEEGRAPGCGAHVPPARTPPVVALSEQARRQSLAAIRRSLRLLRQAAYPADPVPPRPVPPRPARPAPPAGATGSAGPTG